MKVGKTSFFWVSYADLMTSLFFIMLVLFVLTVAALNVKNRENVEKAKYYDQIMQVDTAMSQLNTEGTFKYISRCKKYVVTDLIGKELFQPSSTDIIKKYRIPAVDAGKKIEAFLRELNTVEGFSFLVVLEGNMANYMPDDPKRKSKENSRGYKLSFERALAVYELWNDHGIDLKKYNAEILISGSGFSGECRDPKEENNKRFTVQIIPKIEKLKNE
jgi:hypothetical protein